MKREKEFFIVANSFAAPFFSDMTTDFQKATSPGKALEEFAKRYKHPAGLFAAGVYASAEDYHKGEKPLAKWVCNHEIEKERLTKDKGSYSYFGHGPGDFEINGVRHHVDSPKSGRVIEEIHK